MILRLPIKVQLFNKNDEVVQSIVSSKKSQIRTRLHAFSTSKGQLWSYGTCRVYYNKPNNFWNEFKFTTLDEMEAGLITVTEKPLIDFLKSEIPKEYLAKRVLTSAQAKALTRARNKSIIGAKS